MSAALLDFEGNPFEFARHIRIGMEMLLLLGV